MNEVFLIFLFYLLLTLVLGLYYIFSGKIQSCVIYLRGFEIENVRIIESSNTSVYAKSFTSHDIGYKYFILDMTYETMDNKIKYNEIMKVNPIHKHEIKINSIVEKYVNRNYEIITSKPLSTYNLWIWLLFDIIPMIIITFMLLIYILLTIAFISIIFNKN